MIAKTGERPPLHGGKSLNEELNDAIRTAAGALSSGHDALGGELAEAHRAILLAAESLNGSTSETVASFAAAAKPGEKVSDGQAVKKIGVNIGNGQEVKKTADVNIGDVQRYAYAYLRVFNTRI